MIVCNRFVDDAAVVAAEKWITSGPTFVAGDLVEYARDELKLDARVAYRFADRMLQRMRKAGKISQRGRIWFVVAPGDSNG